MPLCLAADWKLDLIRLHEPGQREGAKAVLRNCFPFPFNRLFSPVSLPRPLLSGKGYIVSFLQGRDRLSPLSVDQGLTYLSSVPFFFSLPPTNSQTECLSHSQPPSSGPAGVRPRSPAGAHMKALPVENPHGTESCPHPQPGPGALNAGPWKLSHNAPGEKTAPGRTGEEPRVGTARHIVQQRQREDPLAHCFMAPAPDRGHVDCGE